MSNIENCRSTLLMKDTLMMCCLLSCAFCVVQSDDV